MPIKRTDAVRELHIASPTQGRLDGVRRSAVGLGGHLNARLKGTWANAGGSEADRPRLTMASVPGIGSFAPGTRGAPTHPSDRPAGGAGAPLRGMEQDASSAIARENKEHVRKSAARVRSESGDRSALRVSMGDCGYAALGYSAAERG